MERKHLVCYCDGGFLLSSKTGGAGVHGYTYLTMSEKQENVNAKWTPTPNGYVDKGTEEPSVSVIDYVDISKGLHNVTSSSQTELNAIYELLKWVDSHTEEFESVKIFTDSKNIVSGINGWIDKWRVSNWKTAAGEPVKFTELWKNVDSVITDIRKNTIVNIEWIKGHSGHLGNDKADELAGRGIILSVNNDDETIVRISDKRGYWNPTPSVAPPRLLAGPRLYTSTYSRKRHDPSEKNIYYIGSHGAKERLAEEQGKVYPCNYLSVIRTNTSDPVIGAMNDLILDMEEARGGITGTLVTFNVQNLLTGRYYDEVLKEGLRFTERKSKPISVTSAAGAPLAEEIYPVGRAFRLADYCVILGGMLDAIDNNNMVRRESLKDYFFDETVKKDGTIELKMRKDVTSATKNIKVEGNFSTSTTNVDDITFSRKLILILGIDTPARNVLSALAKEIVDFDLVSWRESKNTVRYGTYIKLSSGEDGIWAKYDANLLMSKV